MSNFFVQLLNQKVRVMLLRRTPIGPYYARWSMRSHDYYQSTASFSESEARAIARKLVEGTAVKPLQSVDLKTLILAYLNEMFPDNPKNNHSYISVKYRLGVAIKHLSGDLAFQTRRDASLEIQKMISETRLDGKSAKTIKGYQVVLSGFCTWLIRTGRSQWEANPAMATFLKLPELSIKTKPGLTDDEANALITITKGLEIWPVVVLCLGVGLRPIEALRANWSDVDLDLKKIKVFGKQRERTVHIPPWAAKYLAECKIIDSPVFGRNGFTAFHMLKSIVDKKGLSKNITFQACRRTAAKRLAVTMDMTSYAQHFGHSLSVAQKHYLGYGLCKQDIRAFRTLNFDNLTCTSEQNSEQNKDLKLTSACCT